LLCCCLRLRSDPGHVHVGVAYERVATRIKLDPALVANAEDTLAIDGIELRSEIGLPRPRKDDAERNSFRSNVPRLGRGCQTLLRDDAVRPPTARPIAGQPQLHRNVTRASEGWLA